jgi:1,4-dihydroxy-2-naphthoate octaprenyltransferase
MASHNPETVLLLIRAGRFHFLAAGFLLYLIGALFAIRTGAPFGLFPFLVGYIVCGTAHLSVSYSNDYFDRHTDDPGKRTPFSGGSGVLVQHPGLARAALACAVLLTLLSLSCTVLLIGLGGFPPGILLFVAAGLFLGWAYSAPPLRLVERGYGELSTMMAFGFFLPLAGYLFMAKGLDLSVLPLVVPLLFLGLFFIVSVELPDTGTDRLAGKRTLAVRFGPQAALTLGMAAAAFTTLGFGIAVILTTHPEVFFATAAAASLAPLLAGVAGVMQGADEFRAAEHITGRNIAAIVFFCLVSVAALLVPVAG